MVSGSVYLLLMMNQAACRALEQARQNNIQKLVLYTDSKFTINGEFCGAFGGRVQITITSTVTKVLDLVL